MEFFIFAAGLILLLWFMSSRTRKQQRAALQFRDSLEPGQEVMTIGRMYGTVVEVDGDRVTLELLNGVTGQWDKSGIAKLVEPPAEDEYDDDEYDDDEYDDDEYDDDEYDDDEGPQSAPEVDEAGPGTPDEDPTRS